MKKTIVVLLVVSLMFLSAPSYAKFGIIITKVTFDRKSPPEIYIPRGSAVDVRISSVPQSWSPIIEKQLQTLLQRDLEAYTSRPLDQAAAPDLIIDGFISDFYFKVRREERTEERD